MSGDPALRPRGDASGEPSAGSTRDLRRAQFRSTFYDALASTRTVETMGSAAVALAALVRRRRDRPRAPSPSAGSSPSSSTLARAFLPHPRPRRQVHGDAGGHGVGRAHLRPARHRARRSPAPPGRGGGPGRPPGRAAPAVEFRDVWFAYEREQWVLRDCSFRVARGRAGRPRGPDGRGQDDDRAPDDARLRRDAGPGAGRGPRRARVGSARRCGATWAWSRRRCSSGAGTVEANLTPRPATGA